MKSVAKKVKSHEKQLKTYKKSQKVKEESLVNSSFSDLPLGFSHSWFTKETTWLGKPSTLYIHTTHSRFVDAHKLQMSLNGSKNIFMCSLADSSISISYLYCFLSNALTPSVSMQQHTEYFYATTQSIFLSVLSLSMQHHRESWTSIWYLKQSNDVQLIQNNQLLRTLPKKYCARLK